MTSESELDQLLIQVLTCETEDGTPSLAVFPGVALRDGPLTCNCGRCPVHKLRNGDLIDMRSGQVAGRLKGLKALSPDEQRIWKSCNDKVSEMNRISDKFSNNMPLSTLSEMLRISEAEAALTVSLSAHGNNPWAAQACYTGIAGSNHPSEGYLATTASSLSICSWELPDGTFNVATGRLLYVERLNGNVVHVFGSVHLSDAEVFVPSKNHDLFVCDPISAPAPR